MSMPGGWSQYSCEIPRDVLKTFKAAFEGFVGVKYIPLAYASQVVQGANYSFFCNAKGVYPEAFPQAAMVEIFMPLGGGAPTIKKINVIEH